MADQALILSQWSRLGALSNAPPAINTPDIERLLIDTAAEVPAFARLLPMTVSWLVQYHRLVCRHRLAVLAGCIHSPLQSASLGYLLELAGESAQTDHFNQASKVCRPLPALRPLFETYRRNATMTELAREQADPVGLKWGLWAPPERSYSDAIRPVEWMMQRNPDLMHRAFFGGKLPASILVTLRSEPAAGESESALSRACSATRCAVREALGHLELCGLIRREPCGASTRVRLTA